ncbi:MAG: hypothetical protein IT553_03080 [Sphingomonadaceae bacterium]|nr:hypothetical protein [Sphingomonadaceae bacterium]
MRCDLERDYRLDHFLVTAPAATRERAIWLALVTLAECIDNLDADPLSPGPSVRLALAVLCLAGDNAERASEFWQVLRDPMPCCDVPNQRRYIRRRDAVICLTGLARNAGLPIEHMDMHARLWSDARAPAS